MTCYKPRVRVEDLSKWAKAKDGHRYHPAKIFSTDRLESLKDTGYYKYQLINCGECIGCRLDYSRDWANRGYLELLTSKNDCWFITLTYDDNHIFIPNEITTSQDVTYTELEELEWKGALVPNDFTQFMKSLRQKLKREFNFTGCRFIGCGEYGARTEGRRPHYHIILFNCPLPLDSFYKPRISWGKDIYYQNKIIEEVWDKGISNICIANWNNIAYTARYVTEKVNGKESEDFYAALGEIKEFLRSSRQPGIGREYYELHKHEIYSQDQILIRNKKGAFYVKPPKYFDRLYEKEFPELWEEVKKKRKKDMITSNNLKSFMTSLNQWEQLQVERRVKEDQTSTLARNKLEKEQL